jgi:hypothetical protein
MTIAPPGGPGWAIHTPNQNFGKEEYFEMQH